MNASLGGLGTGGHAARSHKRFAASAAERWMACPGSIRLCDGIPETTSAYALEGTQAHELLEALLRADRFAGWAEISRQRCEAASDEMYQSVRVAVDHASALIDQGWDYAIEVELEVPSKIAPGDVGGTGDLIFYNPKTKTLRVDDYKHGSGVFVDVNGNKQTRIYGLGSLWYWNMEIECIELGIIQPRSFHPDGEAIHTETITPADLIDFHADVEDAVARALEPDAPLIPGEAQCRWCPAKAICPAREAQALSVAKEAFEGVVTVNTFSTDRLGEILAKKDMVIDFFEAVEQEAYRLAMSGVAIPGFKLAAPVGKRQWEGNVRSIADELAVLTRSLPDDFLVEKLIGVIEAEKKVKKFGKEAMDKFAKLTVKSSSGKLQLVAADDKRPAQLPASQAFAEVTYIPTGETE